VYLRGLPILDDWIQEAHKGKIRDASNPKKGDKVVYVLLLMFLCLVINLNVVKTCNLGESLNHLKKNRK
jgi:hypothetical protein